MKRVTQEAVDGTIMKEFDLMGGAADAVTAEMMQREMGGGPCPMCGVPWQRVEVRNRWGEFAYYDPACTCFPRCPRCGVSFHRFAMPRTGPEKYVCKSCGWRYEQRWGLICRKCGFGYSWVGHGLPQDHVCPECAGKGKKAQQKHREYGE